jgi:hypothetical protein
LLDLLLTAACALTYCLRNGGFSNFHVGWLHNWLLGDLLIQLTELDQHIIGSLSS